MSNFHSIVVRVDGAIAHIPGNSHSGAVEKAGWAENDSTFKKQRFVEVEWNGEGEYPGAEKIARFDKENGLTQKQVEAIDRHYGFLNRALKGDSDAVEYFLGPDYSDVLDVIWSKNEATPELISKLFCNTDRIKKKVVRIQEVAPKENSASGNSSQLAASGDSSQLAASGHCSQLAASGHSSQLAASGDSSRLAASGDYSQLAASGNSSRLAASGHSSRLAASGNSSRLAASGDSSQLAASGHYSQLAASGDYSQLVASGYSSQLAASGHSSQLAASGDYSLAMCAGPGSRAKAAENGTIALSWIDGKRYRVAVGYVGEDGIKANTWYVVENGKLTEVK
jgi:hypothetical protein